MKEKVLGPAGILMSALVPDAPVIWLIISEVRTSEETAESVESIVAKVGLNVNGAFSHLFIILISHRLNFVFPLHRKEMFQ